MESKKINQLATEMSPAASDLTIIGDPTTGVSKKITLLQLATTIGAAADLQQVTDNGATTTNPIAIGGLTITGLATGVLKSDSGVISSVPFGAANGVATLGGDGKVPSSQLPSYVDDVIEVANYAALPATGETGVLYITLDTNRIYRWTGSTYVEIVDTTAVWGAITGTLSNQTDLQNALNLKANDNAVVHLAGTETISGAKTFSNPITISTASYLTSRLKLNNTELAGNNWSISSGNANNSTNNALFTIINETSSTNTFVLSPTGKLAIGGDLGTTNPADDLGIFSTNTNLKIFDITGNGSALNLQATNTSAFISAAYFTTAIPLVLRTGNTDRLTIAANGNSTFANDLTINGSTTGTTGSFASSGGSDTFAINHSSGSGIALNITKAGDGEGIYVNKTSGSGNAATIVGTLNATTLVKDGGTSSQFLMADGSVNTSVLPSGAYLPLSGGTLTGALSGTSASFSSTITISTSSTTYGSAFYLANTSNSKQWNFTTVGSAISGRSGNLEINNNAADIFAITQAGNVGIGTTSPDSYDAGANKLVVSNTNSGGITIATGASSIGALYFADGTTGSDPYRGFFQYRHSNDSLEFGTAASLKLTIASSGAATFSSSVTTGGDVNVNNGSVYAGLGGPPASRGFYAGNSGYQASFLYNNSTGNLDITPRSGYNTIFTAGNVGIGTSSPSYKLHVYNTAATDVAMFESTQVFSTLAFKSSTNSSSATIGIDGAGNAAFENKLSSGAMTFVTNGSERMRITSGGVVQIGSSATPALTSKLFISRSDQYGLHINVVSGTSSIIASDDNLVLGSSGSERMRITSVGDVLIGATSIFNDGKLCVSADATRVTIASKVSASTGAEHIRFINPNGIVGYISTSGTSTSYSTSSDYRLKQDLKDYNGLSLVSAIKTYDYEWKADNTRSYGVLAHELQEIIPQAVVGEKDGEKMQGVDYSKIVPILVKAIQELNEKIKQLENK